jgi:Flp pilus assembly protein TadB
VSTEDVSTGEERHDMSQLRERRRQAQRREQRRRRLARLDAGLAVTGALVVLLATPGLAIAALVALILLGLCAGSLLWRRVAARRSGHAERRPPVREPIRYP